jgi:hypothetical protein
VKIFTADKIQLRQNIAHSGHRTLALDMTSPVHKLAKIWHCDVAYVLNVQKAQRQFTERQAEALRQDAAGGQPQDAKPAESLKPTEAIRQRRKNLKPPGGALKFRRNKPTKKVKA